jgi:hypothetical protein
LLVNRREQPTTSPSVFAGSLACSRLFPEKESIGEIGSGWLYCAVFRPSAVFLRSQFRRPWHGLCAPSIALMLWRCCAILHALSGHQASAALSAKRHRQPAPALAPQRNEIPTLGRPRWDIPVSALPRPLSDLAVPGDHRRACHHPFARYPCSASPPTACPLDGSEERVDLRQKRFHAPQDLFFIVDLLCEVKHRIEGTALIVRR